MLNISIICVGRLREGHYIAANARQRVLDAHRVLDVMVHIDPEDDSGHSRQMLALPHRAQVEDALAEVLDEHVRARTLGPGERARGKLDAHLAFLQRVSALPLPEAPS